MKAPDYQNAEEELIDWKEMKAFPKLGGECYASLYLGKQIGNEDKEKIIKEARKCNPDIKIYQMTVDPDAFRLQADII